MKSFLLRLSFYLWNFWPPFFGAGIQVHKISKDLFHVRMRLKRRPWNRNLVGTQFGGSMYAMTDPIFMTIFLTHLGKDYIVWDKSAEIRFLKPGKTELHADIRISPQEIEKVKKELETLPKLNWEGTVIVKDREGQTIAEIKKVLHIRKKQNRPSVSKP